MSKCCYISDAGRDALKAPLMTRGDERAILSRHSCQALATWEILPTSGPPDWATESCDSHKAEMTYPGDVAYPI